MPDQAAAWEQYQRDVNSGVDQYTAWNRYIAATTGTTSSASPSSPSAQGTGSDTTGAPERRSSYAQPEEQAARTTFVSKIDNPDAVTTIRRDASGNIISVSESYGRQGGGEYSARIAKESGYSGSGFERRAQEALSSQDVRAANRAYPVSRIQPEPVQETEQRQQGMYFEEFRERYREGQKPIPLFDEQGRPNIKLSGEGQPPEVRRDERYGLMVRRDVATFTPERTIEREIKDEGITLSDTSLKSKAYTEKTGEALRIQAKETEEGFKERSGSLLGRATPYLLRGAASTIEFVGIVPGTAELIGKTAVTKPSLLPKMAAYGIVKQGEGVVEQAQRDPLQLAADIGVSAVAFGGGIKAAKVTGEAVATRARVIKANVAEQIRMGTQPVTVPGLMVDVVKKKKPTQVLEQKVKEAEAKEPEVKEVDVIRADVALTKEKVTSKTTYEKQLESSQGSQYGKYKSQYDVTLNKPAVKLMSAEERSKVIAGIKQRGGLHESTVKETSKAKGLSRTGVAASALPIVISSQKQKPEAKAITKSLSVQTPVEIAKSKTVSIESAKTTSTSIEKEKAVLKVVPILSPDSTTRSKTRPIIDTTGITGTPVDTPLITQPTPTLKEPGKPKEPGRPVIIKPPSPFSSPDKKKPPSQKEPPSPLKEPKREEREPAKKRDGKMNPWYPSSLENVTATEFGLGGRRATHLKSKKETQYYFGRLKRTGRGIPTAEELKGKKKKKGRNDII